MEDVKIPLPNKPVRLLDQFRLLIRKDGKTYATEKTYVTWVKRFIFFHNKQHPNNLDTRDIETFLTHLSVQCDCSPNTQRTALNALVYLYTKFLNKPIDKIRFKYARKSVSLPAVFSHDEAIRIIHFLDGIFKIMALLMYGSGLRIGETVSLRVKDIDFEMGYIHVKNGKGAKDRTTLLPKSLISDLKKQVNVVDKLLALDIERGLDSVYLPHLIGKKYPRAGHALAWQYVFPSPTTSIDPRSGIERRHHIYRGTVQRQVKNAITKAAILKHASCHTFRHSFATRLLEAKYDLKQIQILMGHSDIRTTEIYLHILDELGHSVVSPIDV